MTSLIQRFFGSTPSFEKGAQVLALIILSVLEFLKANGTISPAVSWAGSGLMVGIAFFAQFAKKDIDAISSAPNLFQGIIDLAPTLLSQIADVKTMLSQQPTTSDLTNVVTGVIGTLATAAPAAQVVNINTAPATDAAPADIPVKVSLPDINIAVKEAAPSITV
jgi:hypothetical protein